MGTLTINAIDAATWSALPQAFTDCRTNVIEYWQSTLIAPGDDVSIDVTFSTSSLGGGGASSSSGITDILYEDLIPALQASASNSLQTTAFNSFPASDPLGFGGGWFAVDSLISSLGFTPDNPVAGVISIDSGQSGWDTTVDGFSCAAGKYSLWGALSHELTEVLGRKCLESTFGEIVALYMYSAAGTRNITKASARYLSPDNGATNIVNFSTAGDFFDLSSGVTHSAFRAVASTGNVVAPPLASDLKYMTMAGWGLSTPAKVHAGLATYAGGSAFKMMR